jgi:hypothetical protein
MIDPELVAQIRLLFFAEHWKIGTIATQLNLHRDTVRAALETDRFNRPKQDRTSCKTDPYVDFIRQTLAQYPRLRWKPIACSPFIPEKPSMFVLI